MHSPSSVVQAARIVPEQALVVHCQVGAGAGNQLTSDPEPLLSRR